MIYLNIDISRIQAVLDFFTQNRGIKYIKTLVINVNDFSTPNINERDTMIDMVKISWKLHVIDYIAVVMFSELTNSNIQNLCSTALKEYILDLNYQNAENLIKVLENNKINNVKLYGEIYEDR